MANKPRRGGKKAANQPVVEKPVSTADTNVAATPGNVPVTQAPPQPHWNVNGAQLKAEYLSGGGYAFLANYIRSLPQHVDDITRDFGDDLYERMMLDYQINACIRLLKIAVLKDGVELDPAITDTTESWGLASEEIYADDDDRDHPSKDDVKLSEEICDWCGDMLDAMDRPFMDILFEMMDYLALGNRIGEMVWALQDDDEGEPRLALKNIKTKPRQSYAFVIDAYTNVLGLLGMIPGQGYPVITGTIVGDPSKLPNMLPMEKFFRLTWGSKNNDPRGNPLLRCVYNCWWLKQQTFGEMLKYLAQFASPSLIGYTAENASLIPQTDSLGNVVPGGALVTPEQSMMNTLLGFKNGSVAVFSFGSKVEPLQVQAEGNALFLGIINGLDQQIAKGILCQTLATEMQPHQARAASAMHQDVLDEVVLQCKQQLANEIKRQILYQAVKYNWGEKIAKRFTPKVRMQTTEGHNWSQDAGAVASLVSSKFLSPSQFAALDAKLGLPARTEAPQAIAEQLGLQQPGGQPGAPGQAPAQPGQPGAEPGATPDGSQQQAAPEQPTESQPLPDGSQPPSLEERSKLEKPPGHPDAGTPLDDRVAFTFTPPPGSKEYAGAPPAGWVLVATGPSGGKYYAAPPKKPAAPKPAAKPKTPKGKLTADPEPGDPRAFQFTTTVNGISTKVDRRWETGADGKPAMMTTLHVTPYKGPPPADNPNYFKTHKMTQAEFDQLTPATKQACIKKWGTLDKMKMVGASRLDAAMSMACGSTIDQVASGADHNNNWTQKNQNLTLPNGHAIQIRPVASMSSSSAGSIFCLPPDVDPKNYGFSTT